MNYEEMSDFEINKWVWRLTMNGKTMYCHGTTIYKESTRCNEFDPCNSPSDAWRIIVENRISVCFDSDGVYSHQGELNEFPWTKYEYAGDCDPLRAAMICFLKMKDAENGY